MITKPDVNHVYYSMLYLSGNQYLTWAQFYTLGLTLKNTLSEQRKYKKLAR
jgi:hypothetical protein